MCVCTSNDVTLFIINYNKQIKLKVEHQVLWANGKCGLFPYLMSAFEFALKYLVMINLVTSYKVMSNYGEFTHPVCSVRE